MLPNLNPNPNLNLNRRTFVQGAACLGALTAAPALALAEAASEGAFTFADTVPWNAVYDVVVVGFGGAGAGAAAKAAEAGADVLILEKFSPEEAGGDTYVNLGFVGVVSDDWRQYVAHSGGTATEEKARQICDAAHAAVE